MRGAGSYNEAWFCTLRLDEFMPASHQLRLIGTWLNEALAKMDAKFSVTYEADVKGGRSSIAPKKPVRAKVLHSIRGEHQLIEQISYRLLCRWFVGQSIEDTVSNHSVYNKDRDRLTILYRGQSKTDNEGIKGWQEHADKDRDECQTAVRRKYFDSHASHRRGSEIIRTIATSGIFD